MPKRHQLAFVVLFASLVFAACGAPGEADPQVLTAEVPADDDIPLVGCQGDLPAPITISPKGHQIVPYQLPYTFEWAFSETCAPSGYIFQLWQLGDLYNPENYLVNSQAEGPETKLEIIFILKGPAPLTD